MIANGLKHITIGRVPRKEEFTRGRHHRKRPPQTGVAIEDPSGGPVFGGGENNVDCFGSAAGAAYGVGLPPVEFYAVGHPFSAQQGSHPERDDPQGAVAWVIVYG